MVQLFTFMSYIQDMSDIPNDAAGLRDRALASEAFGSIVDAVRYWTAALIAAEHSPASSKPVDVAWMRRRLLFAQSVLDQQVGWRGWRN